MMEKLRALGLPSPLELGTHEDAALRAPIAPPDTGREAALAFATAELRDPFQAPDGAPAWLIAAAGVIRPLCVGALMAIPTIGTATVGLVAAVNRQRGMDMAEVSIAFMAGIPTEIVVLIGALATGYGVARTVEKLRRKGGNPSTTEGQS